MKILCSYIVLVVLMIFGFISCQNENAEIYLKTAQFDPETRILTIDPSEQQDTVFQQIIHFSGIRQTGYGLILNFNQSLTKKQVDSIKLKFQKLDINAVHDFNIYDTVPSPKNVLVAIENAKFCWVLADIKDKDGKVILNPEIISALKQSANNGGIIVADLALAANLKQLLGD